MCQLDRIQKLNVRHCSNFSELIIFKKTHINIVFCYFQCSVDPVWYLMNMYFPIMVHRYFLFYFYFSDHIHLNGLRSALPMSFSLFYWTKALLLPSKPVVLSLPNAWTFYTVSQVVVTVSHKMTSVATS